MGGNRTTTNPHTHDAHIQSPEEPLVAAPEEVEEDASRTFAIASLLSPSPGPVYMEGRLVLSLSFQGGQADLEPIADDDLVLENYRLWDELSAAWHTDDLAILRFEHADVVMRLEPSPAPVWAGAVDTRARVILVPDLDSKGLAANQTVDLRWKRVS